MKMKKNGVTLQELLLTVAIVALLSAIAMPSIAKAVKRFRAVEDQLVEYKMQIDGTRPVQKLSEEQAIEIGAKIAERRRLQAYNPLDQVRDSGEGVYYFPFTGDDFRTALVMFRHSNSNLILEGMLDETVVRNREINNSYTERIGVTVVFRPKP